MTITFATDMNPISFSSDPTAYELPTDGAADLLVSSPPASPALGATRVSHAKKRDASYIPRPPNAFILFRSSFIRAQHIPGKIEGNHSALSKIIGKYWKSLPREEREVWEARAIVAQAEHRKKYPDWRFRPSANALAKVKDGPKRRANRKGRGEAEKEVRSREKRCARIAALLVEGKTGSDLEAAVKEYDSVAKEASQVKEEGSVPPEAATPTPGELQDANVGSRAAQTEPTVEVGPPKPTESDSLLPHKPVDGGGTPARAPGRVSDARFNVPLTAMFKRSSSAPASHTRNSIAYFDDSSAYISAGRRYSVDTTAPFAAASLFAGSLLSPPRRHEDTPRVDAGDNVPSTHPSLPGFCSPRDFVSFGGSTEQWHQPTVELFDTGFPARAQLTSALHILPAQGFGPSTVSADCWSPPLPAFVPDTEGFPSPAHSPPPAVPLALDDGDCCADLADLTRIAAQGVPSDLFRSSYSSLKGWAGDSTSLVPPLIVPPADAVVMRDAFEAAAAAAAFAEWPGTGVAVAAPATYSCHWSDPTDWQGLQYYAQGLQDLDCRQGHGLYYD
ncbi:uncharacterized protein FIBRA_06567 [Fibroporia radiculosa]|uniref:HMG box domain-containing protein n=1 Tax=Fibroporia radiculosa TaxID=599839 RepID=J4IBB9_9APHY|nr:uncharacterized protein FIBRA_06567 [Fibroporia radiculosa]CCM04391.1 predicted protein [Fibroporia radiculosa]